ncbi:MAG: DNA polymerase III subunit [Planctomycetota bacterium]|jgi:DNA polymerase III gamma/tau subunit
MSLKDIFSQDKPIRILQRAFAADKVPHAYIFAGQEGVGKFNTAGEWSKLLLCKNVINTEINSEPFSDSCGECESCKLFNAGSHPDFALIYKELLEYTKEGKGKAPPVQLPKDVVVEFLIEKVSAKPTLSERKVYLVCESEKLNTASQNTLLKVLEEPPEYCCIILLCTRMEKLLATTKSRCQIIRFEIINEERIVEKLKSMGLDAKKSRYFARLSQGSMGLACQWADLELNEADLYQTKRDLIKSIAKYKLSDSLNIARTFQSEGKRTADIWSGLDESTSAKDVKRRAAKTLVQIVISALNDAMQLNIKKNLQIVNFDQESEIKLLAGRFGPEQSAEKIQDCYHILRWIEAAVNDKLIFEHLLLNLAVSDKM